MVRIIENFFNRTDNNSKIKNLKTRETLNGLKIIESIKGGKNTKVKYINKYELSNLFEGFEKDLSFWNSLKGKSLNYDLFWDLIYKKI